MADHSVVTEAGQFSLQFSRLASKLRCSMPGTIISFDYTTQRATVQPGIKMKVTVGTDVSYVDLPPIQQVPVVVPYGYKAKVLLTHPIDTGDPCLLIFSDRNIDNFLQNATSVMAGSAENDDVTSQRSHHLTDAICIPGLVADPQVLPSWSSDAIELRDYDRRVYISLSPQGIVITDGMAIYTMAGGKVSLSAPGGITETDGSATRTMAGGKASLNAPSGIADTAPTASRVTSGVNTLVGSNVALGRGGSVGGVNEIEGTLKSRSGTFIDANGRDSTSHIHSGVRSGGDNSGPTAG